MTTKEQAIQYTYQLVSGLCSKPEALAIEDAVDERGLILTLKVHTIDMPLIVGRKGSVAAAIRKVLHIWGCIHVASIKLIIEEKK